MNNKSQVVMEFLMTYGWAILVVLVAIAALWGLGIFDPCNFDNIPNNCDDSTEISQQKLLTQVGDCTSMRSYDCRKQDAELVCIQARNVSEEVIVNQTWNYEKTYYYCLLELAYFVSGMRDVPFDEAVNDMELLEYQNNSPFLMVYYKEKYLFDVTAEWRSCREKVNKEGMMYAMKYGVRAGFIPTHIENRTTEVCDAYGIKLVDE